MTNALYAKGAEKILNPIIGGGALSGTLKAILVKNTYAQNLATDEFLSSITAYRLGTDQTIASAAVTGGKLDAADPTWTAVAAGDTAEAVVLYMDTGNAATSPLLAYIDQITGFPLATTGGDITPQWDNGAYKILSLV